jgi:phenylacetate-coenzyme A ligase PaaK-like adenylate-forming protein
VRYGREYLYTLSFLREAERWSEYRLVAYQFSKLRELIVHSVNSVPHYKISWKNWGVEIDRIKELGDLRRLPLTTKEVMRNDSSPCLSDRYKPENLRMRLQVGQAESSCIFIRPRSVGGENGRLSLTSGQEFESQTIIGESS